MEKLNSKVSNAVMIRTAREIQHTIYPPEAYMVKNLLPEKKFSALADSAEPQRGYLRVRRKKEKPG